MDRPLKRAETPKSPDLPHDTAIRLHGRALVLAWMVWSGLTLLSLIDFISSIPAYVTDVQKRCQPGSCVEGQPTPETAHIVHQLGLSVSAYAALSVTLVIVGGLVYCAVAAVILWRKPTEWMALLTTSMLITQGLFENNYLPGLLDQPSSPWYVAGLLLGYLSPVQVLFFGALFPTGRSVSRWLVWVLVALCLIDILPNFFPTLPFGGLEALFIFAGYPLVVWSMISRYRRVSTPMERQQTKWVVFGFALDIFAFLVWLVPQLVLFSSKSQPGSVYDLIGHPLFAISALVIPTCIAIAVLRYRLWDIDTIINKALVYGGLSVLLGAFYAGLIVGLESLAGLLGGTAAQNPVVLVISTLAIAALFTPVRRRMQALIDRRFYRRKYDAEKALAAFSARLRSEVDLNELRKHLLVVVHETMQPTHVSLWLRSPERRATDQASQLDLTDQAPVQPNPD